MEEELEELAKQAAKIAEKVPEKFQEKCFEILFQSFIAGRVPASSTPVVQGEEPKESAPIIPSADFVIPIDVRAFLQQYNVPEENLPKLFLMQANEVRPTYKIKTHKKAKAQIQIATLIALENALKGGKFEFSFENVKQKCKEFRSHDPKNFNANFKNNSKLFKDVTTEEHVELSADGKAELAEVITEMTK